jgi:hypothetical protein
MTRRDRVPQARVFAPHVNNQDQESDAHGSAQDVRRDIAPPEPVVEKVVPKAKPVKKKKREKVKANPEHVARARELRDRYLEQFNAGMVLPHAKYEVSRELPICDLQFAIENAPSNRKSQIANRKSLPQAA